MEQKSQVELRVFDVLKARRGLDKSSWSTALSTLCGKFKMLKKAKPKVSSNCRYPKCQIQNIILLGILILLLKSVFNTKQQVTPCSHFKVREKPRPMGMRGMIDLLINQTIEKEMPLEELQTHFKVLRTRIFPKKPRPNFCNNCMKYDFKNIINPYKACLGDKRILLFIIITTIPKEIEDRKVVRNTWASLTANNTAYVRHVFLFGGGFDEKNQAILDEEARLYGDILQDDFKDNYYNLSYKAIMGFKWVRDNCKNVDYVMRTACDNFVHLPKIVKILLNKTIFYDNFAQYGRRLPNIEVLRIPQRKWYISLDELDANYTNYPPYCLGTAFVYPMYAASKLVDGAANVPLFVIEDAYLALVQEQMNMSVIDIPGFSVNAPAIGLPVLKGCPRPEKWYTVHLVTPDVVQQLWDKCSHKWALPLLY